MRKLSCYYHLITIDTFSHSLQKRSKYLNEVQAERVNRPPSCYEYIGSKHGPFNFILSYFSTKYTIQVFPVSLNLTLLVFIKLLLYFFSLTHLSYSGLIFWLAFFNTTPRLSCPMANLTHLQSVSMQKLMMQVNNWNPPFCILFGSNCLSFNTSVKFNFQDLPKKKIIIMQGCWRERSNC